MENLPKIFRQMGLRGDLETRVLMSYKINAVAAELTGYLYLEEKAELIGDGEGYIVAPTKGDGRRLKL